MKDMLGYMQNYLKFRTFLFCGRHIGNLEGDELIRITKHASKRLQNGIENTGLG